MPNGNDLPVAGGIGAFKLDPGQDLVLVDEAGREVLRLDASDGLISVKSPDGKAVLLVQSRQGNLRLGGSGVDGDILLYARQADLTQTPAAASIRMNADKREVVVGTDMDAGSIEVTGAGKRIALDGANGRIFLSGRLEIRGFDQGVRARLAPDGSLLLGGDGETGRLKVTDGQGEVRMYFEGSSASCAIGGAGEDGELRLRSGDGNTTLFLNGEKGNLAVGGAEEDGIIFVKAGFGSEDDNVFVLNGERGDFILGLRGRGAAISVRDDEGEETLLLQGKNGNISAGRIGKPGNVFVKNEFGDNTIHLSGETGNLNIEGDIRLANADCAERFDTICEVALEPGTVLVIGEEGSLQPCAEGYDRRVAGVVSGAGTLRPGIILDAKDPAEGPARATIAMIGKVACQVDATFGAIHAGDLITTSPTPGHAMRAQDPVLAFGAILGKALAPLDEGRGVIPILVALQ